MSAIIVSVGTSLLTNKNGKDNRSWEGWRSGNQLPDQKDVVLWLRKADPTTASAETNTLHKVGLEAGDQLYYLHSDTPEGEFCARCLKDHYAELGYSGTLWRIAGLRYSPKDFVEDGLRSLVAAAFAIIDKSDGKAVICATGGFKAEMAYLNLVGILTGCPVYYVHERMSELVSLPVLPLVWNHSLVEDNKDFFEWIDKEPRPIREVERRLKALQPEVAMLVVFRNGFGRLSAAGEALYLSYLTSRGGSPVQWPPDSGIEPAEKIKLDPSHTDIPSGTRDFVDWLSRLGWVQIISYAAASKAPGLRAKVISPDTGELKVRYGREFGIEIKVMTTARGQEQCQLVADYIEQNARNFR